MMTKRMGSMVAIGAAIVLVGAGVALAKSHGEGNDHGHGHGKSHGGNGKHGGGSDDGTGPGNSGNSGRGGGPGQARWGRLRCGGVERHRRVRRHHLSLRRRRRRQRRHDGVEEPRPVRPLRRARREGRREGVGREASLCARPGAVRGAIELREAQRRHVRRRDDRHLYERCLRYAGGDAVHDRRRLLDARVWGHHARAVFGRRRDRRQRKLL